jgi:F420-dependent oxidoreductase-like protein
MRFVLMIEAQQGVTYDEQLEIARHAEAAGFEAYFRSDHYESFPGPADNPTTDAWAVLAGLARETSSVGLGVLVSPVTFRHPGNLAKLVTTVDHMSGGRLEFGIGAGWNDSEHERYGFAFPPIDERADMLEEQLEIVHGLLGEPDGWSFRGRHYRVEGARTRPRAVEVQGRPSSAAGIVRPRIIVGGGGTPRSMRIAARWADEFNVTSSGPEKLAATYAKLDSTLRDAGREPSTLTKSAMVGVLVARDEAELRERERSMLAALDAADADDRWWIERRKRWIHGTPDAAREAVRRFAAAGAERLMLQDFLPRDLDMIDLLGRELVGKV